MKKYSLWITAVAVTLFGVTAWAVVSSDLFFENVAASRHEAEEILTAWLTEADEKHWLSYHWSDPQLAGSHVWTIEIFDDEQQGVKRFAVSLSTGDVYTQWLTMSEEMTFTKEEVKIPVLHFFIRPDYELNHYSLPSILKNALEALIAEYEPSLATARLEVIRHGDFWNVEVVLDPDRTTPTSMGILVSDFSISLSHESGQVIHVHKQNLAGPFL